MKKFFFSLDNVLNFKKQVLENLKGEHARVLASLHQCEREIELLEEEHRACTAEFNRQKLHGMKIADIYTYEHYLDSLGLKIQRKREELSVWREREEKKRSEVVEAKQETSSIDKLKEKKLKEYEKAVQKQEELFIEEFVSAKNAMERLIG